MYSLWQLQNSGQQGKGPNLKVSGHYGSTTGCYFGVSIACTTGLNVTPGNPGKNIFRIREPIEPTDLYFTNNIDTSNIQVTPVSNLAISTGETTSINPAQTSSSSDSEGLNNCSNSSQGVTSNHSRSRHPFRIPSRAATPKEPQTKTAGRAARETAKATAEAIH